jgi:hypothetical protein
MIRGNILSLSLFHPVFIALLFLMPLNSAADDPWNWSGKSTTAQEQEESEKKPSVASGFFISLLTFFSKVISPVDGHRCPSYPTCAAYSKQAYQKHGAILGTLMTVDRLFHEADEARFSPIVEVYGVRRIYDPVSANEFWKRDRRTRKTKAAE